MSQRRERLHDHMARDAAVKWVIGAALVKYFVRDYADHATVLCDDRASATARPGDC